MSEGGRKKSGAPKAGASSQGAAASAAGPKSGSPPASPVPAAPVSHRTPAQGRGAERRLHHRVATTVPFRIVNDAGREEQFHLVDLSETGARIQVRTAIPPMTRIQVILVLPGPRVGLGKDVRVDTTGVVVWCHRTEDAYDTGVFFPDLGEEQRGMLRVLVRSVS